MLRGEFARAEVAQFHRLLQSNIARLPQQSINSTGYVIHTLEASIWCLLNAGSYHDTVLTAVNLGDDTDTTGAVAGGLAGIIYGYNSIPLTWINVLARKTDIEELAERLDRKYTLSLNSLTNLTI